MVFPVVMYGCEFGLQKKAVCECVCVLSCVQLSGTACTVAHQAPVSEILQVRTLEWVAIFFSRGSSLSRDQTHISCFGRRILYDCATREAAFYLFEPKELLQVPFTVFQGSEIFFH